VPTMLDVDDGRHLLLTERDLGLHAGYCDSDELPGGRFATREGNSNKDGSSNGTDLVEIEPPRHPGEQYVFVYWWEVPTTKHPTR